MDVCRRCRDAIVTLADLQAQMMQALFDREHEATAAPLFNGDSERVRQALAYYRGNLGATWEKSLGSAYPVVKALVGDEFFAPMVRVYGRQMPSTDGDVHRFGARFAEFLAGFAPVTAYPYFAGVAQYEWALHRAHFADRIALIDRQLLASKSPQQLEAMRFRLNPACTLLESTWAISAIWHAHQNPTGAEETIQTAMPQQLAMADHAITIRPQWKVDLLPLSAAAYRALRQIEQGACLGDAVDAAFEIDEDFAFAMHLQQWIDGAILGELPA